MKTELLAVETKTEPKMMKGKFTSEKWNYRYNEKRVQVSGKNLVYDQFSSTMDNKLTGQKTDISFSYIFQAIQSFFL